MNEADIVAEWFYSTIHGDPVLAPYPCYEEPAPAEATFPRITFSQSSGGEVQGHNAIRIFYSGIWLVKGIDRYASFSRLKVIANRLDEILHRADGLVVSGNVLFCVREESIRLAEIDNGIQYRHSGFLFRVGAQE
jgi:hypothetical protein